MTGGIRKRLNEPLGERRPARPPRPWILRTAVGIAVAVIVAGLIYIVATGTPLF